MLPQSFRDYFTSNSAVHRHAARNEDLYHLLLTQLTFVSKASFLVVPKFGPQASSVLAFVQIPPQALFTRPTKSKLKHMYKIEIKLVITIFS